MVYSLEVLQSEGKKYGIKDITEEEYEANKRFNIRTALTRILNTRRGTLDRKKREHKIWKGILLGGSDIVTKKVGTVENSRGQRITLLRKDEDGEYILEDMTRWGHLPPDFNHGDAVEIEVEINKSTNESGQVFVNKTIRNIKHQYPDEPSSIQDVDTWVKMIEEHIDIQRPGEIKETQLYEIVAVKGVVASIDQCPKWEEGMIVENYPIWYNNNPCLRLQLRSEGSDNLVRLNLQPTRLSSPLVLVPDFNEICQKNDPDECIISFVNQSVIGIGKITRYNIGEPNYIDIDVTALLPTDPIEYQDTDEESGTMPRKQYLTDFDESNDEEETNTGEIQREHVARSLENMKKIIREMFETLGEITIVDVKNTKKLPEDLSDAFIEALMENVREEMKEEKE